MSVQTRVPRGTPTGGRFTHGVRHEADLSLFYPPVDEAEALADVDELTAWLRSKIAEDPAPTSPDMDPQQRAEAVWGLRQVRGRALPPMIFFHAESLDRSKITDISNSHHPKPDGGLWLSRGEPGGQSTWQEHLALTGYERPSSRNATSQPVALREEAAVLVIDSREDLLAAAALYPGADPEHEWQSAAPLDYEAIAENFDAVWVTADGRSANHLHHDGPDLYGWDIESVLVLNPSSVHWPTEV